MDMQPANVKIADIIRHDLRNWYIIKDSRTIQANIKRKYTSAKPRNIILDRIGTWNYKKSKKSTGALINVRLNHAGGKVAVKTDLALRFQYGGRVASWEAHPELHNKGRFLRKIRVVPLGTHVAQGYRLDARVKDVVVSHTGTSDPIAQAKLKIRIVYGKKGSRLHKRAYVITVKGSGSYSARRLGSGGR